MRWRERQLGAACLVAAALLGSACGGLTLNGVPLWGRPTPSEPAVASPDVVATPPGGPTRIDPRELARRVGQGERFTLVDLRSIEAHAAGHVAGARRLSWADVAASRAGLAREGPVVVYCDCPRDQVALGAALDLRAQGHEGVLVLTGGLQAWQAAGLPVATAPLLPEPTPVATPTVPG